MRNGYVSWGLVAFAGTPVNVVFSASDTLFPWDIPGGPPWPSPQPTKWLSRGFQKKSQKDLRPYILAMYNM